MKKLFVSVFVLIAGIVLIILSTRQPEGPRVGQVAPGWSLVSEKGETKRLSDYRGQVILLNFWATWCPPCVFEMPSLQRLHRQFLGKKFRVVAVGVDENGWSAIRSFLRKSPVEFDLFWDQTAAVSELYGVSHLPESYLINQEGIIIKRFSGPVEWDSPEIVQIIERLTEPLRN